MISNYIAIAEQEFEQAQATAAHALGEHGQELETRQLLRSIAASNLALLEVAVRGSKRRIWRRAR